MRHYWYIMGFWNNIWQNDALIVFSYQNVSNRKQLWANGRKRFPSLQSWGTTLNIIREDQEEPAYIFKFLPSQQPTGWTWFHLVLDVFSRFWASGGCGPSGNEWERENVWYSLFFFANFWNSFVIVAAAHLGFWGVPGISNTPRIIFPLGKTHKMALNLALS